MIPEVDGGLWRDQPGRWVRYRANWLRRRLDVPEKIGEAIAWSELGYSCSGIAEKTGRSPATIDGYLEEAAERFGAEAALAQPSSQLSIDRRFDE